MNDPKNARWGSVDTRFDFIHFAARERNIVTIRELLSQGVDADSLNGRAANGDGGNTPLWFAAQGPWPNGLDVARELIEAGADVNRQCGSSRNGDMTTLDFALWRSNAFNGTINLATVSR